MDHTVSMPSGEICPRCAEEMSLALTDEGSEREVSCACGAFVLV